MMGNLRNPPLFLRPSVARRLITDIATIAQGIAEVPILPIKLVDQPKPSAMRAKRKTTRAEKTRLDSSHAPAVNDIEFAATCPTNPDRAGGEAEAPEGTSEEVAGDVIPNLANASAQPTLFAEREPESWPDAPLPEHCDPDLDRAEPVDPPEATRVNGFDFMRGRSSAAPRHVPAESRVEMGGGDMLEPFPERAAPLRNLGRGRKSKRERAPVTSDRRAVIRRVAEEAGVEIKRAPAIDWTKVAAVHAAKKPPQPKAASAPTMPAPSREECPRCGIPGWKGCAHFLPCEDQPARIALPQDDPEYDGRVTSAKHRTGGRQAVRL